MGVRVAGDAEQQEKTLDRELQFFEILADLRGQDRSVGATPIDWEETFAFFDTLPTLVDLDDQGAEDGGKADEDEAEDLPYAPPPTSTILQRSRFMLHGELWYPPEGAQDMAPVLILTKVRKDAGRPIAQNFMSGEKRVIPMTDNEGIAHESHIAFLPNNVIAIIQNGRSSPSVRYLEQYLRDIMGLQDITISPLSFGNPTDRIGRKGAVVYSVESELPPREEAVQAALAENRRVRATVENVPDLVMATLYEALGRKVKAELRVWVEEDAPGKQKTNVRRYTEELAGRDGDARPDKIRVRVDEVGGESTFDLLKNLLAATVTVKLKNFTAIKDDDAWVMDPTSTSGTFIAKYRDFQDEVRASIEPVEENTSHTRRPWWRALLKETSDEGGE